MEIFIKSFNRPYYLERCLRSLYKFVKDIDLVSIKILEDGTPKIFLDKILEKFPNVDILYSEYYDSKVGQIAQYLNGESPYPKLRAPVAFWRRELAKAAGDYFLLIEDDMWLNECISLHDIIYLAKSKDLHLIKFFSVGNPFLKKGNLINLNRDVQRIEPKLFTLSPTIYRHVLQKNTLKIGGLLRRLNILKPVHYIEYYTIYNVAGVIMSKSYYNFLWKDHGEKIDENNQLVRALLFYNNHKESIATFNRDILHTSFSSSATNTFLGIDLDIFHFNNILNNAWNKGLLDSFENFPNDFSQEKISEILEETNNNKASSIEWLKWQKEFKDSFRRVGHQID